MNRREIPLKTHLTSWRRVFWRAKLETLKRSSAPILVGPWRGEVGYESLYWIPFLERVKQAGIDPQRLIPIGRAGSAAWYGCPQGLELYALRDPKDVRIENRKQAQRFGYLKQEHVDAFDRGVLRDAATRLGLTRYQTLHPAWMYHVLAPFYTGWKGVEWFAGQTAYQNIPTPPLPDGVTLPEPYVAVRFYGRETFPWQEKALRTFVNATIETLAQHYTVLLIDSADMVDDHMDMPITFTHPNVRRLSEFIQPRPETALAIHSAVISRALGFVGTYGGLAQLALRIGKASVSFYHHWGGTSILHKHLADLIAIRSGIPCQVYWTQEIGLSRLVLPDVLVGPPKKGLSLDTRLPVAVAE